MAHRSVGVCRRHRVWLFFACERAHAATCGADVVDLPEWLWPCHLPRQGYSITFQNASGTVAFLTDVTGGASPGNFTTITLDNNITFEGATADDYETTLTAADPTADRTVTIPDATGQIVLRDTTDTLTNKTIALGSNTVSGTTAQ